ncbi:HAD family hydrolase [Paraburkholderia sp. 22099]|jgi:2-haloalkanoic acid dehalogenase type II|uniref:2-haloalkanoic acid dehalogenase type II n=1 Tax=Paraburkholderia terricola TaxID=169427 RepID=A0ABU1LJN7_9BURK|nr:HAD-IA family hydrolase [Paraburkholderia terricola]ORC51497.1 haloacid dehalogenase [Burkholderia sp. A27]AXE96029.1 haloacid dehalogenase [Paraburkholderia terricola]MDR6406929.1 2-haloalkanoic acid dehalogenase type II [Paraburkholderia terricola]MDR6446768.1 2-haloalkanoic acid dehalogenase type II [Paraburkholderia terricola]MDR6479392.1 2-haloalkanoic acid dehalogenase type II [Paraburkholderia terricola]
MTSAAVPAAYPKAVLFDLLTALLDSWSSWNRAAGSEQAGRAWRAAYLRLTYGCGRYIAYEQLVRNAAEKVGLPESAAFTLEADWLELAPWPRALETLQALKPHCKLAVVTNCSARLGKQAADLLPIGWDAIVTAEEAGVYKPNPLPYRLALEKLGVQAHEAAFVAGSSYDMFGTAAVGLRTYWHNHVGLPLVTGAQSPEIESPTLDSLVPWLSRFGAL